MTDSIDGAVETMQKAGALIEALRTRCQNQRDALAGMVGLVQLVLGRDDLTPELRFVLETNHRIVEAVVVLNRADTEPL